MNEIDRLPVQAHIQQKTSEATDKAWHLVKLMETDYGDKLVVSLLKIELLSSADHINESEYYNGELLSDFTRLLLTSQVLARMIRTIVLNDTNFKTIIHHVHKLKNLRYRDCFRLSDVCAEIQ